MPEPVDQSMTLMMGEMRGQLRELIHSFNNLSQKFEGIARTVDSSAHIPGTISELNIKVTALDVRVTALEAMENQRKGAITLGAILVKCIPWFVGGGAFAGFAKLLGV